MSDILDRISTLELQYQSLLMSYQSLSADVQALRTGKRDPVMETGEPEFGAGSLLPIAPVELPELVIGDVIQGHCGQGTGPSYEGHIVDTDGTLYTVRMLKVNGEALAYPFPRTIDIEHLKLEFLRVLPKNIMPDIT